MEVLIFVAAVIGSAFLAAICEAIAHRVLRRLWPDR